MFGLNRENTSVTEATILKALQAVRNPDLHRDIVSLGFVKDAMVAGGNVSFTIGLATPASPVRDKMKEEGAAQGWDG